MPQAMERPTTRPTVGHARRLAVVAVLAAGTTFASASAQAPVATPPPADACCSVPAGTVVELQLLDAVNSRTAKRGDRVRIRLSAPVTLNDVVVLPAGLDGEAEVIHAERSRGGGKPGELLLAARFLRLPGGGDVTLKAMKLGGSGKANNGGAFGVALVAGPFGMLVRGGELEIAPGTPAHAKLGVPVPMAGPIPATAAPRGGDLAPQQQDAGTDTRERGADAPPQARTSP